MVIQYNMAAVYADYQLGIASKNKLKCSEKLSTGYKINRAADNAAGLAISEKLRSQIRGLYRSQVNIQDGISFCNVADGALNEVHNMLDRLKEVAVQAANDTYTDQDRENMDAEVQQLKGEMSSIFENTNFNTINLWQAAYIPNTGGECQDFSLYNVNDGIGSYYGGIAYMNHRYSWEDLGITNWDSSSRTFTSEATFKIDSSILHNNGQNSANDPSSPNDDYLSDANSGAVFTIHTTKNGRAIDIEKSYRWSADNNGIYIDGVMTDGSVPNTGNTTWPAMGLTPGQDVNGGEYTFEYYGMEVSFEVPEDGATWNSFLGGFNNPLAKIDWHSKYFTTVSEEVADITNTTNSIIIDNSNKDYISADADPYIIYADSDGLWMENSISASQALTKAGANQTLIRWEDIANIQGYDIHSWGLDTGGADNTNVNSPTNEDGGDTYVTLSSDATYHYSNPLLGGGSDFSFEVKLMEEASRSGVISDINNSHYKNLGIISPTGVNSYTSGTNGFSSSAISASLTFLTQRDTLNRTFSSNNETFANGALSTNADKYEVTLSGTNGGTYILNSTENCSSLESRISADIMTQMASLYNPVKTSPSDIALLSDVSNPATSLGLGNYVLSFQDGFNNVSLQLDLSNVRYGDIISSIDYGVLGITPDSGSFASKVGTYVSDKMSNFLDSTFSIAGSGPTYQDLGLQEKSVFENAAVNIPVVDGYDISLSIQSGAQANMTIDLDYEYLRLGTLGIKTLDILTSDSASAAIKSVDGAIEKVSEQRSVFGAYTNQLQHVCDLNSNSEEYMQNAESKIRDADMAKEMMGYFKHNILEQVGQTVLAQSNQNTKSVLDLL